MDDGPRTWKMYGHQEEGTWLTVGEKEYVKLFQHGSPPVPVTVTEDPDGDYMGWLDCEEDDPNTPVMILHRQVFDIQFTYGYKPEEERGKGKAIYLTITIRHLES